MDNLSLQLRENEMAKSKLPSVDDVATQPEASPVVEAVESTAEQSKPVLSVLTLEIPSCAIPQAGYVARRADVRLTRSQAATLRSITRGLQDAEATLANGRYVTTATHAIQWVLENAEAK